jgi:RTX calcium-binding nonapeptide repeat (4 copies)
LMAVACSTVLFVGVLTLGFGFNATKADHGTGLGQSFLTLAPGFTQEIFGVHPSFLGGIAFAPDGDPLVANCVNSSGSPLQRFDRQGVAPVVNSTNLHPVTALPSDAGCGLTNHPNRALYSNTSRGVVKLDPDTGAFLAGPFGPNGNALGIAIDPQTGNLVYVGSDGTIHFVDAALTTTGVFSTVTTGDFVDGILFDPLGDFLFLANRSPSFALTILRRDGTLVQDVPMSSEPDGIAFTSAPKFMVTNNLDGTMTRFDFPADDFTQVPVQSVFATGGHRGDLVQVGPDGCLFVTQAGTRYDNGALTGENSLVRICTPEDDDGGFVPPPGVLPPPAVCGGLAATLVGTAGNNRLVGTAARDIIHGLEGDDVLQGLGGNDLICGGPGNDLIRGGTGRDRILGEAGRDDLRGQAGRDVLDGGPGNDKLNGGGGRDSCKGGAGRDGARGCERVNRVP